METLKRRSSRKKARTSTRRIFLDDSFWSGWASILDLFGQFNRASLDRSPWEADFDALRRDHFLVAGDARRAIEWYQRRSYVDARQGRLFDPDNTEEHKR